MSVDFYPTGFYISLVLLALVLIILRLRKRNIFQVVFIALFGIYLMGAVNVAVFPFIIDYPNSNFRLSLNLVPFNFGSCFDYMPQNCFKNIFNNILLTVPFGFGVHFIAQIKSKNIPWLIVIVGCSFEFVQLVMALVFHTGFRTIDINDVILNAAGVALGYGAFRIFGVIYSFIVRKFKQQPRYIFAYIYDVVRN